MEKELKFTISWEEIKDIIIESLRDAIKNDFRYIAEDWMFQWLEDVLSLVIEDMKDEIKNELLKDKKIKNKIIEILIKEIKNNL